MLGTSKSVWGFDPRSVPGCQLWLDGADSNTVTGTTSVTAWNDKSGNGYVANSFVNSVSNPSWVSNVQNGNGVIQYSAGNGSSIANFVLAQTMSIFKVYYPINQNTGSPFIEHGPNVNNESGFYFHAQGGQNFAIRNESGQGPVNPVNFGNTTISNTWQMIQGINPDPSNSNAMTFYLNGTVKASSATTGSGTQILTKTLYINGRGGANNLSYNTYLAELIIYNIGVTTSQRQQIEGYLAHKWGLNGYYDSSIPLSIPGCQLWLDAADSSTITGTTSVTAWRDKSGNSNNPTIFGSPNITVGTINNVKAMWFNGTSGTWGAFSNSGATVSGFAVGTMNSGTAGYGRIIGLGNNPGNDAIGSGFCSLLLRKDSTQGLCTRRFDIDYTYSSYTYDAPFLASVIYDGTNGNLYINGATIVQFGSTGNFGYSNYSVGCGIYSISENTIDTWKGYVGEVILYRNALTTTQRQSIEGYLARKWGLTSMYSALPSIHPFSSIRPHLRTFQPTDIPGCQLWLDGADQSSLVLSGSNVTQWTNKGSVVTTATPTRGSTANQITYVTVDGYPGVYINNNNSVLYNSSTYSQLTIQSNFQTTIDYSVFAVVNLSNTTVSGVPELQTIYANARGTSGETRSPNFGAGITLEYISDGTNRSINSSFIGTGRLQTSLTSSTSDLTAYKNGTVYASNTSSFTRASSDSGALPMIGGTFGASISGGSDNRFATGYFHEILVFSTALTTSQRQQIEGYLAHKWGLTLSLPVISPLSIPGCQLWLDGADPAGTGVTPSNGATVSTWVDKSGNGYNAAASGTMTIGTLNNIPAIVFPAASTAVFLPPASLSVGTNGYSVFFVANQTSFSSGGTRFYSANSGGVQAFLNNASPPILSLYNGSSISSTFTVVASTPFLYSYTISSSAGGLWKNGTLAGSSGGSTTAISTFYIGNFVPDLVYAFTGQMGEFIIYNSALTTTQRQSIEGYLARKWGISISATLPSPHPFKSFPPAKAPMIIGLVNRWIFNNGSGSTVTDTVGGQNISLSGTYTWSSSVPNSEIALGSLSFNGYSGTGSAAVNATLQTSTYTMTLWYYHTGVSDPYGNNPIMIGTGFNQNEAFAIATGGFSGTSKPYFFSSVYNGGFFRSFSSATPLNTWTHLAVTIGNSTYNAYQNGVLDSANTNISITSGLPLTLNGSFIFAKGDSAYGNRFGGSLFDVRIYNRALSASEISQIYNGIG